MIKKLRTGKVSQAMSECGLFGTHPIETCPHEHVDGMLCMALYAKSALINGTPGVGPPPSSPAS
jgi:hypothetical protein